MSEIAIVFSVLGLTVVLFVWNRFPVEIVALGASLTLAAAGVITVGESLGGFGDLTVLYIAALFVVSEGIDGTGVTTWAGQWMIARAGDDRRRLVMLMMLLVAVTTAVISVNGAVAALLPMAVVVAIRIGSPPSRLLLPVAFGAHAGSLLALTGTPVHILVVDAAVEAGEAGFNYFEFALVGVPLVLGAIALTVYLGPRLLPDRKPASIAPDLSGHARTLYDHYALDDWVERLEVGGDSALIGVAPQEIALPAGVHLVAAQGRRGVVHAWDEPIGKGFVVTVRGDARLVEGFAAEAGLTRLPGKTGGSLIDRQIGVAELVVPPRSALVGEMVFPGMVTAQGDLVVLAVQRNGVAVTAGATALAVGDVVLVQGTWSELDTNESLQSGLLVHSPSDLRRQAVPLGRGAKTALAILGAMVVLLATNAVPAAVAAMLAAGAMILTGVVSLPRAYRAVSWTTVVLVAAMIPISQAVTDTGAADLIADGLVGAVGDLGPYALLLGLFVVPAVVGQLISNMATALIVIPIAVAAAAELNVSPRPVLMSVTVAAAAAFLTPVATPANLMVMQPAGYRFGDYWKLGLPMLLLFMVAAVFLVPVFWPF